MTAKLKTLEISVYGVKMTAEFYHTPGEKQTEYLPAYPDLIELISLTVGDDTQDIREFLNDEQLRYVDELIREKI